MRRAAPQHKGYMWLHMSIRVYTCLYVSTRGYTWLHMSTRVWDMPETCLYWVFCLCLEVCMPRYEFLPRSCAPCRHKMEAKRACGAQRRNIKATCGYTCLNVSNRVYTCLHVVKRGYTCLHVSGTCLRHVYTGFSVRVYVYPSLRHECTTSVLLVYMFFTW